MAKEEDNEKAVVKKEEEDFKDLDAPIPPEILDKMPPEARRELKKFFSVTSARFVGPIPHPLSGKITEEHVTKIIDYTEKDDQRDFQEGRDIRRMSLIIFFAVLIFSAGITVFFTLLNKTEFITPFMTGLLGAAGGFGGGYGLAKYRK